MKLKSLCLISAFLLLGALSFQVVSLLQMSLTDSSSSLTSHAPILIDGDANFTAPNGVTGDSGTALAPGMGYEGWNVQRNPKGKR